MSDNIEYIDRVKIIRCGECKHYYKRCCHLFDGLMLPHPDDFCSYAERSEEDEKRRNAFLYRRRHKQDE